MTDCQDIVFFTSFLGGPQGTAKSARDFLRALLANHSSVSVVSPIREQFPQAVCQKELARPSWFALPKPRRFYVGPKGFAAWYKSNKDFYRLRRLSAHDVLIVNGWASYKDWQYVQELFTGRRAIIVRESPRHFIGPDRRQVPTDLIGGFASFDHLIFVSERVCNEWLQYQELAHKPYSVLPNCCEEEEVVNFSLLDRDEIRQQLGFGPDDFVVICPGSIEHRKGQDLLLEVIEELRAQIPGLRILLVGDPATQWGEDLLHSIAPGLKGNIVQHWQSRPSIMDVLHAADVLAFPSRAEAMPRTILEAMVMKTPVVASDVDGIPELIEDGRTGLLFASENSQGLLDGLLRIYREPQLGDKMATLGSERYWDRFSRKHQFERMAAILESFGHCSGE